MPITPPLARRLFEQPTHRVIVQVVPGQLDAVVAQADGAGLFRLSRTLQERELPPFPPLALPFGGVPAMAPGPSTAGLVRRFPTLSMLTLLASPPIIGALSNLPGVVKVFHDPEIRPLAGPGISILGSQVNQAMGVDKARAAGLTGKGVKVAVLDTDPGQPYQFSMPGRTGESLLPYQAFDENGHGTHVASAIASRKWTHPTGVEVEGVAPDVELRCFKVLGWFIGTGNASDAIAGIEAAVQWGADIINMSLGSEAEGKEADDPMAVAINLVKDRTIPVVAVGNSGSGAGTVNSPGIASGAITVGSWGLTDQAVAHFSSRGPTPDGAIKPDCLAPGGGRRVAPDFTKGEVDEKVVRVTAPWSFLDGLEDGVKDGLEPMQGSSMAAPAAAGLLALVVQRAKASGLPVTADGLKQTMAAAGGQKDNDQGYGLINWSWFE